MTTLEICVLPVLSDNYVFLIHDPATGATACVDPAVSPPVIRAARDRGWSISHILVTHPHWDHTDRKSTRLNSSHITISYAVFCLKKKKKNNN